MEDRRHEMAKKPVGYRIRSLPLTLINHATAPHAFDLMDESETTRDVIRRILGFRVFHLHLRA
jgi:hypothetical protein